MGNKGYRGNRDISREHMLSTAGVMAYPRTHVYDSDHAAHRAKVREMDARVERDARMASERDYNTRITAQAERELQEHEAKEMKKKVAKAKIAADEEIYYLLS